MENVAAIAGLVAKAAVWLKDSFVTDEGFIRAYYLEVSKNIEILKLVDIPALKNEEINSPAFKSLVNCLETEIGVALLCSDTEKRKRILSFLREGLVITKHEPSFILETGDDDAENAPAPSELRINVYKAVWFTVQKIELLKTIAGLDAVSFKQGFHLAVRVGNILERFKQVKLKLERNDTLTKTVKA